MVLYLLIHDAKSEIFCDILKSSWDHVVWEEKLSRTFQSSRLALRLRDPPKLPGLHNPHHRHRVGIVEGLAPKAKSDQRYANGMKTFTATAAEEL